MSNFAFKVLRRMNRNVLPRSLGSTKKAPSRAQISRQTSKSETCRRAINAFLDQCFVIRCFDFCCSPNPNYAQDAYTMQAMMDADGAEVERQTLRYMPESVDRLLALTNFDRRELKTLYRNFKNECPNGVVNEETFKSIYCQFFPNGDADMYAHYVFRAFDSSEEDHLNFEEFAIGLSSLLRGSLVDRLQWTFRLYDINHDGYITREEMLSVIKSVYQLLGAHVKPAVSDENYLEHTDRIFTKLDVNGDGLVTMEEFCDTCSKDESIVHSMSIFDHAL